MGEILSYRGLLQSGGQDRILLSTKKGKAGYRIIKFQTIGKNLTDQAIESVMQIWETEQTTVTDDVDFSSTTLLAVSFWKSHGDTLNSMQVVFDQVTFNQDIYITNKDNAGSPAEPCNYYLELERVPLSEEEAMVTTIMSIRNG